MASKFGRWVFGALSLGAAMVAAPRTADAALVGFCDFSNAGQLQGLTLNGSARAPAGVLFLTPNLIADDGSAYLTAPVHLSAATSFQTHFTFRIYPNATDALGGSGVAFVLQNKAPTALSGSGSSLGLNGVTPSVAVEFDTEQDNNGDRNSNHVGVILDGKMNTHLATATPSFNMKNGTKTDAWIDYDAPTKTLKVYIAQNQPKPAAPLLTTVLDIYTSVDALGAGNKVWIGFSGATDHDHTDNEDIQYWVFANDGTPLTDCKKCLNNNDCVVVPTTPVCNTNTGFCVECIPGQEGQCTGPTTHCDPDTSTCVQCNDSSQCGGNTPVCENHVCVGCEGNYTGAPPPPATCPTPTQPVCQLSTDPQPGTCTQCSSTDSTQCTGPTPVCITSTGTCGCTQDSQCGAANGGVICNSGVCTPGCRPDGSVTCPTGGTCQANAGGTSGTCVQGCTGQGQCNAPTPVCDTTSHNCVQCVTNNDCAANQVCTPQNTCGQCSPTNTTNCDPNGTGGACRPNGQCGCNTDADCGGPNSGRVCDDTNKVCRTGCRGTGGNECPPGQRCTSTTGSIGMCVTDPGGDAGVDGGGTDGGGNDGGGNDGGGPGNDGGTGGPGFDSGTGVGGDGGGEGGLTDDISIEGGGCNCNVPAGNGALPMGAFGAAALGLVAVMRRRRGKR